MQLSLIDFNMFFIFIIECNTHNLPLGVSKALFPVFLLFMYLFICVCVCVKKNNACKLNVKYNIYHYIWPFPNTWKYLCFKCRHDFTIKAQKCGNIILYEYDAWIWTLMCPNQRHFPTRRWLSNRRRVAAAVVLAGGGRSFRRIKTADL